MIKECKKGYDVNVRKIGTQTNIILPFANDGANLRCKTEKCEFIETCEYKDYINNTKK
ncbi:hypothetical protein [Clostridium saccharoperbutylacetonicum]|uniref:Uncharacterized protein n=1 Tax=Clostridium saccharoperbutylacetonicum N1-4(HMT) TaxID=931276 RepID=M1MP60_9CLOT|nr:hypothetical protein [Clostridium saccharoperbutylacetonicum]AGF56521.1 hypothetical protein Cspa_c27580 [Clostridium saccharoperbutylacetonicum N1-4(HMT)]AQR95190.1 hypothetical protein CLSAP_25060 [Clostridium saccharoperbutylacetonicum]NRT62730.1 hypothetical protein [Clostridium saccharoperbutylacetonicum]NSB26081.1 hypothetical protein [Clostridium saccharoperbutylacetonicum]NSB31039.1 hypothetical protein [Clostridium saccharoperbutylacetonicum]